MNDLISRKAAIDALVIREQIIATDTPLFEALVLAENVIKALPPAQPEIVRCKDCKFYEIYELKADNTDDKRYKPSVCVKGKFAVKRRDDWYCADAERRTDE